MRPLVALFLVAEPEGSLASSRSWEGLSQSSASPAYQARPGHSSHSPLFFCELRRATDFQRGRLCAYQWHLRACVQEATVSCPL